MEELAKQPNKLTDPFESIYGLVFQLTMRTVGCVEICRDPVLLKKVLKLFESFERSTTAAAIIFPWLPGPAIIGRAIAAGQLYRIFKKIIDDRAKSGRKEQDPLQVMIDRGDNMRMILSVMNPSPRGNVVAKLTTCLVHRWRSLRRSAEFRHQRCLCAHIYGTRTTLDK